MIEVCVVASPVGRLLIEADEVGVTALSFVSDEVSLTAIDTLQSDVLKAAVYWLERYFQGGVPRMFTALHLRGTPFQMQVWHILQTIPYGTTVTYGDVARVITKARGGKPMSAQAVGSAVGKNPVAIMVPCHRVVGANGKLTGYAAGLDKKIALLMHEHVALTEDNYSIKK